MVAGMLIACWIAVKEMYVEQNCLIFLQFAAALKENNPHNAQQNPWNGLCPEIPRIDCSVMFK